MSQRKRSQARMLALQALCLYDALGNEFNQQIDRFLTDLSVHHEVGIKHRLPSDSISFARELASEAWSRRHQYNDMLERAVSGWSVRRMPPVDRNILRLGFYELLEHPETPHQVVINEAIELARRFGDADSPAFINGVLDAIWRETGLGENIAARPAPADDLQTENDSSPERD